MKKIGNCEEHYRRLLAEAERNPDYWKGALEAAAAEITSLLTRLREVEWERDHWKAEQAYAFKKAELFAEEAYHAEQRVAGLVETMGFIESAALFHPEQAWPDELKAQLRRIGKMAHDAALTPPQPAPIVGTMLGTPITAAERDAISKDGP